ncbi:hypothetical protein BGZ47_006539 [Haplosporangium gracile]|nr:hypothetical protein BGZ47_006539 [Haplosporangium gracile]
MQLKTILTVLTAVLVVVSAAPAADISAVPPGSRLSKAIVDINDDLNDDLNDATSKIIVYPDDGGGRPYPGGGRTPTIIIIKPYSHGPVLLKRPRERSNDANEASKILIIPGAGPRPRYPPGTYPGYPPSIYQQVYWYGGAPPFGKRASVEAKSSKKKDKAKVENEVDWEDDYDGEDEKEDAKYSLIYPPSPYWDSRHLHIMTS